MAEYGFVMMTLQYGVIPFRFAVPTGHLTRGDEILMVDLCSCFSQPVLRNDGSYECYIPPYVIVTGSMKEKLIAFIKKYAPQLPQLMRNKSKISAVAEGTLAMILPEDVCKDQQLSVEAFQDLCARNNMPGLPSKLLGWLNLYEMESFDGGRKHYIGQHDKNRRVCRWCGKKMPEVTFYEKAHAISEALGNKQVILCDECDGCNGQFGRTIENAVIAFLQFDSALFGIHGKNGIPEIKRGEQVLISNDGKRNLHFEVLESDARVVDGLPVGITIRSPQAIIKQDVYRGLCKYALSCVSQDVFWRYLWLLPWLNKKCDFEKLPLVAMRQMRNVVSYPLLTTFVRKVEEDDKPSFYCTLSHGLHEYAFVIPCDEEERVRFAKDGRITQFWRDAPSCRGEGFKVWDLSGQQEEHITCNLNFQCRNGAENG